MFTLFSLIHVWYQCLIIVIMLYTLQKSEECLNSLSKELHEEEDIPNNIKLQMLMYSFFDLLCSYFSMHSLIKTLPDYDSFLDAIVASILISLFVFLLFSGMKHIACYFHFFRVYDIENGAISLLTLMSIIIRFIFVTPVWVTFLCDTPLTKFPEVINELCIVYLLSKIGCLWILCLDFSKGCDCFFRSVYLRSPVGVKCENCLKLSKDTPAAFTTQCGHNFCRQCIDKARKVHAVCPVCGFSIPRKWSMTFKYRMISFDIFAGLI